MTYTIEKLDLPFETAKWAILPDDKNSGPFGVYPTKKAALADAKEYGLKITK